MPESLRLRGRILTAAVIVFWITFIGTLAYGYVMGSADSTFETLKIIAGIAFWVMAAVGADFVYRYRQHKGRGSGKPVTYR